MLLEGEPEKTYNLHRYEPDKMEALRLVWKSLKAQYGNPDHDPINEMQERSECPCRNHHERFADSSQRLAVM